MAFILHREREQDGAGARYRDYLESVREQFPPSAWALATSDWYFSFADRRCPHDAWLEVVTLSEPAAGERQEDRVCSLRIRLLNAHQDGCLEFSYPRVYRYSMACCETGRGHGDWRYDEFRLSGRGHLLHEIEWWSPDAMDTRWLIEASDVHFQWLPRVFA